MDLDYQAGKVLRFACSIRELEMSTRGLFQCVECHRVLPIPLLFQCNQCHAIVCEADRAKHKCSEAARSQEVKPPVQAEDEETSGSEADDILEEDFED